MSIHLDRFPGCVRPSRRVTRKHGPLRRAAKPGQPKIEDSRFVEDRGSIAAQEANARRENSRATPQHAKDLSNEAVLAKLDDLVTDDRNTTAKMIEMLIIVEERRLHLELAYASMFDFCRRKLGLSEGSATRRLTAARLVKRFPRLLDAIEAGRIHLSSLVQLRDLLTEDNVADLVAAVSGKSKREVLELVARLAPKPDVDPSIRRLPEQGALTPPSAAPSPPPPVQRKASSAKPASLAPLSEGRYKVEFTADAALCAEIDRARALMRHRNPNGDLTVVFAEAMKALLEKLEKERLGKTARPRASRGSAHNRLAAEQVFGRDYVDERIHRHRRRCGSAAPRRELVRAALVSMGFKASDAERAIGAIETSTWTEPIDRLLRDALGALT